MSRIDNFTFRVSPSERHLIAVVAAHMERTESDTIRHLLREAACKCGLIRTEASSATTIDMTVNSIPTEQPA